MLILILILIPLLMPSVLLRYEGRIADLTKIIDGGILLTIFFELTSVCSGYDFHNFIDIIKIRLMTRKQHKRIKISLILLLHG